MVYDVREVGNAILDIAQCSDISISNMSLNKILYFTHAWHLVQFSEPLIDTQFEAWQYGPVHPQIYRQFKSFKDEAITNRLTKIDFATGDEVNFPVNIDQNVLDFIAKMVHFYGRFSATKLVKLSHEAGAPWDQIWSKGEKSVCLGMVIPDSITEAYYRSKKKS